MTESSMTAVVEYGPNQLKLESVPIPTAAANEVLTEIEACGVCTSDVKAGHGAPRYWGGNGQPKWIREPVVPGHDLLDNKQVPQTALLNMPVIKKDKVDYYYSQLYVKLQDFLKALPDLIKKNMASGDYASQ
ncbi:MAG: hypothetical protein JOZ31_23875 [Verrucomicrobia bacterium]|nr:hypothetical protein [Verrucomicrobiota bacterium]MBV8484565.1 hypothetical protein [Verrucomicrobiota bacterium]